MTSPSPAVVKDGVPPPVPPSNRPSASTFASPAASAAVIARNAIRYTVSEREYALLHRYVLARSRALRKRLPVPASTAAEAGVESKLAPSSTGSAEGPSIPGKKRPPIHTMKSPLDDGDYNARAVRHAVRVFLATAAAMKAWEMVRRRLPGGHLGGAYGAGISSSRTESAPSSVDSATKRGKYPILRSSLSLSLTLLLYRLLFRFLSRLRAALLHRPAEPFRRRNPRITAALTSVYAPSVGASLAGLALGIFPSGGGGGGGGKVVVKGAGCRGRGASSGGDNKLRRAIALYALFRAGEFAWDLAEREGWVWGWEAVKKGAPSVSMAVATAAAGVGEKGATATTVMVKRERPWWFGSWLLQPLAFAQLLDAVVFERDCFPVEYGNFIFSNSPSYIHPRPPNYPAHLKWPSAYEVVDGLRDMAKLKWPHFTSPTLFPSAPPPPTPALRLTAPLSSGAHPLITHLSCATIHPHDPSCARTFLSYLLVTLPALTRSFLVIHSALLVLTRLKALHNAPVAVLRALFARSLRFALFATGAIGTAWASICASQHLLPGRVLSRARFAIGGALAGLWAFLVQDRHRGRQLGVRGRRKSSARMLRPAGGRVSGGPSGSRQLFLYSARIAAESFWRVGVAHRWWRPIKGGDVLVFVAALGLVGAVYEKEREGLANRRRERAAVVRRQRRLLKELGEEDAARGEDESADDPELAAKAWMKGFRWIRGEGWGVDEEIDGSVNDGEDRFS